LLSSNLSNESLVPPVRLFDEITISSSSFASQRQGIIWLSTPFESLKVVEQETNPETVPATARECCGAACVWVCVPEDMDSIMTMNLLSGDWRYVDDTAVTKGMMLERRETAALCSIRTRTKMQILIVIVWSFEHERCRFIEEWVTLGLRTPEYKQRASVARKIETKLPMVAICLRNLSQ
jgi:hypothetical protein